MRKLLFTILCITYSVHSMDVINKEHPELKTFLDSEQFKNALGNLDIDISDRHKGLHAAMKVEFNNNKIKRSLVFSKSLIDRKKFPAKEFKFILCHELGHQNDPHLLKMAIIPGMVWILGTIGAGIYCAKQAYNKQNIGVPLRSTVIASTVGFALVQYFERLGEYFADKYALQMTQDKNAAVAILKKRYLLQEKPYESTNLFMQYIKAIFADHPSSSKRIKAIKDIKL